MKVLIITGSRHGTKFLDELQREVLDADLVIHGDYGGVDAMAESIAKLHGVHTCRIAALWKKFDKAAGPKRNGILDALGRVLRVAGHDVRYAAFPSKGSAGTWHMVKLLGVDPPITGNIYKDDTT